jgi:hypothetical protein
MYCFNVTSGMVEWAYQTGGPIKASPYIDKAKGAVYVGSGDGYVHAVDARFGLPCWKYRADSPVYSTPLMVGNKLYVCSYGTSGGGGTVYSLILPDTLTMATPTPGPSAAPTPTATPTAQPVIVTTRTPTPEPSPGAPALAAMAAIAGAYVVSVYILRPRG